MARASQLGFRDLADVRFFLSSWSQKESYRAFQESYFGVKQMEIELLVGRFE
jgi:hypothetical protein